jgi:hypothetical protein
MNPLLKLYAGKQRKYRNVPTEVDGVRFDSKREATRWGELNMLVKAGEISDLRRQHPFRMEIRDQLVCTYIADFSYLDHESRLVVEDVKSPITRKDPVYRIKAKLLKACHGLEVREI